MMALRGGAFGPHGRKCGRHVGAKSGSLQNDVLQHGWDGFAEINTF
jgi:hypothetical protein